MFNYPQKGIFEKMARSITCLKELRFLRVVFFMVVKIVKGNEILSRVFFKFMPTNVQFIKSNQFG